MHSQCFSHWMRIEFNAQIHYRSFSFVQQVINFSTGRVINKALFDNEVTAMDHDHTGQLVFCGDAQVFSKTWLCNQPTYFWTIDCDIVISFKRQGCVYTVTMNSHTGALSKSHRNRNGSKRRAPITIVQYRIFSLLAHGPVLLACGQDGSLSFFRFFYLISLRHALGLVETL